MHSVAGTNNRGRAILVTSPTLTIAIIELVGGDALKRAVADAERQATGLAGVTVISIARSTQSKDDLTYSIPGRRRAAVDTAQTDYIALAEDTIRLGPDWIASAMTHISASPAAAVFGPIKMAKELNPQGRALGLQEYGVYGQCNTDGRIPGACMILNTSAIRTIFEDDNDGVIEHDVAATFVSQSRLIACYEDLWVDYFEYDPHGTKLSTRFSHGRYYAASVLREKPFTARMVTAAKSVLLPLVLSMRALRAHKRDAARSGQKRPFGWIVLMSAAWSFGEFTGAIAGMGNSEASWR